MAKKPRLKVFTAPIGFHDVYVAAPSRAAALRAWGSDHDLFARGVASEVTDAELIKEPLAKPGEVIRRLRGTAAEQFAALPENEKPKPAAKHRGQDAKTPAKPARKAVPRPSRAPLDEAEAVLKVAEARHTEEDAAAKARVEEAQRQRRDLQHRNSAEARELAQARNDARERYERAIERWRHSGQ